MSERKQARWSELSTGKRRLIAGAATVQLTLLVAALTDLRRRSDDEVNGSKRLWTAASFVNFIGPIAYFVAGRKR